ncbi:hypothetical protein [Marinobacter similis]|uniref:hypothetical protein n=1 Tax=Marinobacter similis TaxID=1420916 RepID=UPI000A623F1D|nr:hypothetical protein [Marinobacter similis]
MSKRFSTLDTTRLLFEHPKILFRMIERMDRNEARYIRESDLVAEVMDYTRTLGNADRDRVRLALNTDNLFRSGLVIDIIKAEGERRLVFQDALINLMRACNASLYQELTDARLRGHLVTLRDVRNRLETSSFSAADLDYTELRDDLNERVSQLIGLLRQNVLRMQTISAQLADLSGDASRAPEKYLEFRQNLFEQIVTLYERHIKPTLVFLNPDTRLPDGSNLFETLEAMVRLLESMMTIAWPISCSVPPLALTPCTNPFRRWLRRWSTFCARPVRAWSSTTQWSISTASFRSSRAKPRPSASRENGWRAVILPAVLASSWACGPSSARNTTPSVNRPAITSCCLANWSCA